MTPEPRNIPCPRHRTEKPVAEHLTCPYCYERRAEVLATGEREAFCDFDPERDPIAFGFPDGMTRALRG